MDLTGLSGLDVKSIDAFLVKLYRIFEFFEDQGCHSNSEFISCLGIYLRRAIEDNETHDDILIELLIKSMKEHQRCFEREKRELRRWVSETVGGDCDDVDEVFPLLLGRTLDRLPRKYHPETDDFSDEELDRVIENNDREFLREYHKLRDGNTYDDLINILVEERNKRCPHKRKRLPIPHRLRKQVLERDGYRCQECGDWHNLCVDHRHPHSKGGRTTFENLQTLCRPCNLKKRDSF